MALDLAPDFAMLSPTESTVPAHARGRPGPRLVREVKVLIPIDLHLQLVRRKLLRGQTIASTVQEALDAYFAAQDAEEGLVRGPPGESSTL